MFPTLNPPTASSSLKPLLASKPSNQSRSLACSARPPGLDKLGVSRFDESLSTTQKIELHSEHIRALYTSRNVTALLAASLGPMIPLATACGAVAGIVVGTLAGAGLS